MLFKEQIEKRREQEHAELHQAVDKFADEVGLKSGLKPDAGTGSNAIKEVLGALGIKDGYEWDPECIFYTKEELCSGQWILTANGGRALWDLCWDMTMPATGQLLFLHTGNLLAIP